MTSQNPWQRLACGGDSIFAQEPMWRTPEYRSYCALTVVKPPPWPEFRDARLRSQVKRERKPQAGHANLPLNLPGSLKSPLRGEG